MVTHTLPCGQIVLQIVVGGRLPASACISFFDHCLGIVAASSQHVMASVVRTVPPLVVLRRPVRCGFGTDMVARPERLVCCW